MTNGKQLLIGAACVVGSVAAAFAASGSSQTGSDKLRCEIAANTTRGQTVIEGLAHANTSVTGTYSLRATGPGTNINQGGEFQASAGRPIILGSVMLGGGRGGHEVRLEVKAGGQTASCTETVALRT